MIPIEGLQYVCSSRRDEIATIHPFIASALEYSDIMTPLRASMFIAQAAHESMGFTHLEEIASGQAYENRADLGNTSPGDGVKYKGRGIFQITGKNNYGRCSQAIFRSKTLLLDSPGKLSEPKAACDSAVWFWDWKNLNELADNGDIQGVTRKINGGLNGLAERMGLYKRAMTAFGIGA